MRRIVFLLLILCLLLGAQWVSQLASRAVTVHSVLKVASLKFYYKLDENARFLDLKTRWQTEHQGELSIQKAASLAEAVNKEASVEAELPHWRYQGGPSPKTFTAKLHLYNSSQKAILSTPLSIVTKANVASLRVSPATQLTDYEALKKTARWEMVSTRTVQVPVIAPGEDQMVEVMQFRLLEFLSGHPNQWPVAVRVTVSSPQLGVAESELSLLPDHFVIPTLY